MNLNKGKTGRGLSKFSRLLHIIYEVLNSSSLMHVGPSYEQLAQIVRCVSVFFISHYDVM